MLLTDSHYIQLIGALCAGVSFFVAIYLLPARYTYAAFTVLIPFQIIDSRFGSVNTVLAYMWFIAFVLIGRLRYLPLMGPMTLIVLLYALAFAVAPVPTMFDHGIYLFSFFTNFLLFVIAYNVTRENPDWRFFRNVIVACNILVVLYCIAQVVAPQQMAIGGISEFALQRTRANRLTGPFNATAATADYLVIMCLLLFYAYLVEGGARLRVLLISLVALNTSCILMTGNRGGFLLYFIGGASVVWGFRAQLGAARTARVVLVGICSIILASVIVLNTTRFNVVFDRLSSTTFESGVIPDTRTGSWSDAWEAILESPIKGHGPMLRLGAAGTRVAGVPQILFPHSLPLYILYTTGIIGLVAFSIFFGALGRRLSRSALRPLGKIEHELAGIPRLNLIIFVTFIMSQLRIEILREGLFDFQQFIFLLLGSLLGFADTQNHVNSHAKNPSPLDETVEPTTGGT